MSIINDAIKKARKEFEIKNKVAPSCVLRENAPDVAEPKQTGSDVKWTVVVVASLVLIVSLLGSLAFYKHFSRSTAAYDKAAREISNVASPGFNMPFQKQVLPSSEVRNAIELNGIVYGPEGKWAIINDRIVREGDSLLGGEITLIAKDFVKIEKDDGGEIVLDLK